MCYKATTPWTAAKPYSFENVFSHLLRQKIRKTEKNKDAKEQSEKKKTEMSKHRHE